jgi:hypothetical protein
MTLLLIKPLNLIYISSGVNTIFREPGHPAGAVFFPFSIKRFKGTLNKKDLL